MTARSSSRARYGQRAHRVLTFGCSWVAALALLCSGCGEIKKASPDASIAPPEPDALPACSGAGACPPDSLCDTASGQCVEVCSPGLSACGDVCVDTANNPNHCGGCRLDCSDADQICDEGACVQGKSLEISRAAAVNDPNRAAILLTDNVWPGWRFEVPADVQLFQVTDVGYQGSYTAGSIFAAIVALDGPTDEPDALDLTGDDVVKTAVSSANPVDGDADIIVRLDTRLEPGWYAVIFGSNAFGASGGDGLVRDGQTTVQGSQLPFAINQEQNRFQLQVIEARLFIRGFAF